MFEHPLFWQVVISALTLVVVGLGVLAGRWLQSRTHQNWLTVWGDRLRIALFGAVWSIRRVEGITLGRAFKGKTDEEVARWREENRAYLEAQARRRKEHLS